MFTGRFVIGLNAIESFWLVKRCQIDVDPYQPFELSSPNRSYEIKNTWTWDESENVDETRNWWQMGVGDIDLLMKLKMEIILILLNWI